MKRDKGERLNRGEVVKRLKEKKIQRQQQGQFVGESQKGDCILALEEKQESG